MHVLAGTASITNPQRGEVWIGMPEVVITTHKGQQQKVDTKNCPAVVPGRRQQVECRFEAHWHTEKYPRAGDVKAVVTYAERDADEEEEAAADVFESARVPFDFAKTKLQQAVGSAALVETGWAPAAAGQGVLHPARSTGEKPKEGERIDGSRAFKFTAVFEPAPTSQSQLCARPWKVRGSRVGLSAALLLPVAAHTVPRMVVFVQMCVAQVVHRAKVTPLGSGNRPLPQQAQVDETIVNITFTGCLPSE